MRILDRLVLTSFIKLFVGFVVGAPLLFILADATETLGRLLNQGVSFSDATLAYVYEYPYFFMLSFPVAALLATVFTVHPMTTHREIMAAKAGGIPFHRIVLPIFMAAGSVTVLGLFLSDVVPRATRIAADLRGDRSINETWRTDFVYITDSDASLSVRRLTAEDGRMLDVTLQRHPYGPEGPLEYTHADQARYMDGQGWLFLDGFTRYIYPDDEQSTFQFESALVRSVNEHPVDLLERVRDEEEMTYAELKQFGERLFRSGGDVGRTYTHMEQRIAIPVAAIVIAMFAAPLATSSKRGGAAFGVGLSLATTIAYLAVFRVSSGLGHAGALPPLVAAWLPNVMFLVAAIFLLGRVRT